jgi:secreted trypsin-like serine protease
MRISVRMFVAAAAVAAVVIPVTMVVHAQQPAAKTQVAPKATPKAAAPKLDRFVAPKATVQKRNEGLETIIKARGAPKPATPAGARTSRALIAKAEAAKKMNVKILGGAAVTIANNPWQVALLTGDVAEPGRWQFCGGSIIDRRWILTAAHCVNGAASADVDILAGTDTKATGGERVKVATIFVHSGYNATTQENDVALLKLAQPLTRGQPIKLLTSDASLIPGTGLRVTGWGTIAEGGDTSPILLGATMPVIDTAVCNQPTSYNGSIKTGMFCAGFRDGGLDSCQGDSGGPATVGFGASRSLAGVVSWGEGCARELKYGVYAGVPTFAPWIAQTRAANP